MKLFNVILTVCLILVAGLAINSSNSYAGEDQNLTVVKNLVDAFNNKDINAYTKIYSPDVKYHGSGGGDDLNLDQIKSFFSNVFKAYPNGKLTIEQLIAKDDEVVYRLMFNGKNTGTWMGMGDEPDMPATDKMVSCRSIGIAKFKDGKIVEEWENFDDLRMLKQLGVFPPPMPDASKMSN
ncbi:ester cyclase [candidate division KSB1 bacterium]|nr:ester cyclase [candidate division KSB1 bacterium]